jgi:glutamine cyclotransferase
VRRLFRVSRLFWLTFLAFCFIFGPVSGAQASAPVYEAEIVAEHAHNPDYYTQGLFFDQDNNLYESTGLYGRSRVIKYRLDGDIIAQTSLPPEVFGEGSVLAEGKIYVLTWTDGLVFILDSQTLAVEARVLKLQTGWGLTFDGTQLWRSDGTDRLFRHRLNLESQGPPLPVRDGRTPVRYLNELEYDPESGLISANIYGQSKVAFIDPASGQVRFYLEAKSLMKNAKKNPEAVLNGLAVDSSGRLFMTGKLWPKLYEVKRPEGLRKEE